tara:strand:- start:294 stop:857 length:564 start_codon:yes stop_codon:yes gene_type:complete
MNLYLFGGSFDPPHLGHKEIIKHFIGKSDLFVVSPAFKSPFKDSSPHVSFLHREKMLKLMLDSDIIHNMIIIDYECINKSPFTVDTVKYLRKRYLDCKIHMIIGADQFNMLESWKDHQYISENVTINVVSRPGDVIKNSSIKYDLTDTISIDVSSSYIRDNIYRSRKISKVLDERVLEYILNNKLYG